MWAIREEELIFWEEGDEVAHLMGVHGGVGGEAVEAEDAELGWGAHVGLSSYSRLVPLGLMFLMLAMGGVD
jgi:hypothetical protein